MHQSRKPSEDIDLDRKLGTVAQAMTTSVVTLDPGMRASDAALLLGRAGITGGPVVDAGRVVGVITLSDLLEREGHMQPQTTGPFLRGERHLTELAVEDVMTKDVVTARAEWPLARAIVVMDEAKVNRLPVLDAHDRPVGILARDDIVRAVARSIRHESARAVHPSVVSASRIPPD